MPWERSYISMQVGMMLTTGLLLQSLLLGTTWVAAQEPISSPTLLPTQPKPIPTMASTIRSSTTTIAPITKPSTKLVASTTPKSSDACLTCNSCSTGTSSGAIAGIVIAVLIVYIVSLILVAILVSVLTKRGTLDLSKFRVFKTMSNGGNANVSSDELADQNDYIEDIGLQSSPPQELYTSLDRGTREETPAEPSPYQALRVGDRKPRKPKIKKKPAAATAQPTDDEIYQNCN